MADLTEEQKEKARVRARARYNRLKDDPDFKEANRQRAREKAATPEGRAARNAYVKQPDQQKKRKEAKKAWDEENKDHVRAYSRAYQGEKYKNDPHHNLKVTLRNRLNQAMKKGYKQTSAVRDLGMSIPAFKHYIEDRFMPGMAWSNKGEWHLDHVKPLDAFDLFNEAEQRCALHYTNYQPLWGSENQSKNASFSAADEQRYYHERAYPDNF